MPLNGLCHILHLLNITLVNAAGILLSRHYALVHLLTLIIEAFIRLYCLQ